jgi:hypothetical protein
MARRRRARAAAEGMTAEAVIEMSAMGEKRMKVEG